MCGLVGIFRPRGRTAEIADIQSALTAIRHRGPDGFSDWRNADGSYHAGFARLAIIDIKGADQPLVDPRSGRVLFGNGEIPPDREPEERGSNAFAFAPHRTADGSTVLVSNSHQPWEGAAAWYEARVASGEGWSMQGALFPGSPVILMGHNAHLGWTNTVNRADLTDVYKLALDDSGKR